MAAPGDDDDRGAGVDGLLHQVDFDRRVMDRDDAADAAVDGLAHVVDLRHVELVGLEVGRVRREERHHDAAGQDGLRGVGLAGVGGRLGQDWGAGSGGSGAFVWAIALVQSKTQAMRIVVRFIGLRVLLFTERHVG